MASHLSPRHIQDHNEANTTLEQHWGYPSRVLPCRKDEGTCEYLTAVYWMHDVSMLYTFILWGVLLGLMATFVIVRSWRIGEASRRTYGLLDQAWRKLSSWRRRWLLVHIPAWTGFGHVSRLQVLIFMILLAYLLIFSYAYSVSLICVMY
jgi:hypothetical protein